MQKFDNLTLLDSIEFISENEMKKILGGYKSDYNSSNCPPGFQKCKCTIKFKDGEIISGPHCTVGDTTTAVKELKQIYMDREIYGIHCSLGPSF